MFKFEKKSDFKNFRKLENLKFEKSSKKTDWKN
jgi:hypothetical protein